MIYAKVVSVRKFDLELVLGVRLTSFSLRKYPKVGQTFYVYHKETRKPVAIRFLKRAYVGFGFIAYVVRIGEYDEDCIIFLGLDGHVYHGCPKSGISYNWETCGYDHKLFKTRKQAARHTVDPITFVSAHYQYIKPDFKRVVFLNGDSE